MYVYMYVCMYVCICMCVYVCRYVYVCIMSVCMYVCVLRYVCMYVCVYCVLWSDRSFVVEGIEAIFSALLSTNILSMTVIAILPSLTAKCTAN